MPVAVKVLSSLQEFAQAEEVQLSAWGMSDRMVTPKEAMMAMQVSGGLVLGAMDGARMVGVSIIFPGYRRGKVFLYSHQTGVVEGLQSRGIGYLLKRKQREVAMERGLDLIAWTFDPLIARNAYFNFGKLGVVARNYHVDFYGSMDDSINYGWPTDRFLCEWYLAPRALERVRAYSRASLRGAFPAVKKSGDEPYSRCRDWEVDLAARRATVDIPQDVVGLKRRAPEEARRWREATREVFQAYFRAGYSAVALLRDSGGLRYLLAKARLPRNVFSD